MPCVVEVFVCVMHIRPGRGGVRFSLEFEGEKPSFAANGLIRWADPDEGLLGLWS